MQLSGGSVKHVSGSHAKCNHKSLSPQVANYLEAPSAIDSYTGMAERAQNSERYMEKFLNDWDKIWKAMSDKKDD